MFGNMQVIQEMEDIFHGSAWKKCDEEFRQLRATSGMPWLHFEECIYMRATSELLAASQMHNLSRQAETKPANSTWTMAKAIHCAAQREVPEEYCQPTFLHQYLQQAP